MKQHYLTYLLAILGAVGSWYASTSGISAWWVGACTLALFGYPVITTFRNPKILVIFILLSILAFGFEMVSIITGFPYGKFVYGQALGPKLFDLAPWVLPLSWPIIVMSIYSIVLTKNSIKTLLLGALCLVLYDLVLDPVAVKQLIWIYQDSGWYYGVPFSNFIGWMVSGVVGIGVCLVARLRLPTSTRWSYNYHLVFWTTLAVLYGLVIPVLIGILLCGYFVIKPISTIRAGTTVAS